MKRQAGKSKRESIDAKAPSSEREVAKASPTNEPSVFFRTNIEVKSALDSITNKFKKTQSEVLSQLILAFVDLSPGEQFYVLEEAGRAAPFSQLQNLVAELQVANHSFALNRWLRSVEDHERLLEQIERQISQLGMNGSLSERHRQGVFRFRDWAIYRLAYIWIDVATERRASALLHHPESPNLTDLGPDWEKTCDRMLVAARKSGLQFIVNNRVEGGWELQFQLAIAALRQSLEYGSRIERVMVDISAFNIACVRSLLAQYTAEFALLNVSACTSGLSATGMEEDFLSLRKRLLHDGDSMSSVVFYNMLVKSSVAGDLCFAIQGQADEALRELNGMYKRRRESGEAVTLSWLLTSLRNDKDLSFVMNADGYKSRLGQFLDTLSQHGDTVTGWCQRKLARFLPDAFKPNLQR